MIWSPQTLLDVDLRPGPEDHYLPQQQHRQEIELLIKYQANINQTHPLIQLTRRLTQSQNLVERLQACLLPPLLVSDNSSITLLTGLVNQPLKYLIKINKTGDDLLHELIIGLYVTNRLREIIPNFSYVYSWAMLGPTVINDSCHWAKLPGQQLQLFYEYVPGPSFKDYCATCSPVQFVQAYLQVLLSLKVAQRVDFSHYDLHYYNIILRPVSLTLNYPVNTKEAWSMKVDGVATFIDYGRSHASFQLGEDNYNLGFHNYQEYGIEAQTGRPLHDAFKLLGYLGREILDLDRQDLVPYLRTYLGFFVKLDGLQHSSLQAWLQQLGKVYFCLTKGTSLTLDDYLAYLQGTELWSLAGLKLISPEPNLQLLPELAEMSLPFFQLNQSLLVEEILGASLPQLTYFNQAAILNSATNLVDKLVLVSSTDSAFLEKKAQIITWLQRLLVDKDLARSTDWAISQVQLEQHRVYLRAALDFLISH